MAFVSLRGDRNLRWLTHAGRLLGCCWMLGCNPPPSAVPAVSSADGDVDADIVTIAIVGTNDLHGALDRLPVLAGHLDNLRAAFGDNGAVVLVDGGDMFQGTLASNEMEGAPVVEAYGAMGYVAAAVGNHEFDFGPVGPAVVPQRPTDDPIGALKARAAEAKFPLLVGNILDASTERSVQWPHMPSTTMVEAAGVKIGVIGVTTESTPNTTMAANVVGLKMEAPATSINREGVRLREAGANVIVVAAHIGGKCTDLQHPNDLSSCETGEEIFGVIDNITPGLVDVIVAAHTHQAMAHRVRDIAVIESYASGQAFGRVDLRVKRGGHVVASTIHPPRDVCSHAADAPPGTPCAPAPYEGRPVVPNAKVASIVEQAMQKTAPKEQSSLGVKARAPITRSYSEESALGNWFTDLMLAADPKGQVAMTNGGGLRADIPAGLVTYGALYRAMPFDNLMTRVTLTGSQLRQLVTRNVASSGGFLSWGGLRIETSCANGKLDVHMFRGKRELSDTDSVVLLTSDFLASSPSGAIGRLGLPASHIEVRDVIIRDAIANVLRAHKQPIDPALLFDRKAPRVALFAKRPLSCQQEAATKPVAD